jgi:hypothetical protein
MPISPIAIQDFLDRPHSKGLPVKGKSKEYLQNVIYHSLGFYPKYKTEPRQLQYEGLAHAFYNKGGLIYFEVKTGKTLIALKWFEELKRAGRVSSGLFVAHAPVAVEEWRVQSLEHTDLHLETVYSGPNALFELLDKIAAGCDGIILSLSALRNIFGKMEYSKRKKRRLLTINSELIAKVAELFDAVVFDEIHKINHTNTVSFKCIKEFVDRMPPYRLGLTGTPIGRDPHGLWAQAYIIDGGRTLRDNFYFFKAAFAKSEEDSNFDEDKLPLLRAKLNHMIVVGELSEIQKTNVIHSTVNLKMSQQQQSAYRKLTKDFIKDLNNLSMERIKNIFIRQRQLASGFEHFIDGDGEDQYIDYLDAVKFVWLEEFIAEIGPIKCVIFYEFTHTGMRICQALQRQNISHGWLYGKTKNPYQMCTDFQNDKFQILVSNHKKGGTSLNFSSADYLCIFESPVGYIDRAQMLGRPMARGERPLVVDDLLCAPVEYKIQQYLKEGKDLSSVILKDPRLLVD